MFQCGSTRATRFFVALLVCLSLPILSSVADEVADEFRFASGLIEMGFVDFGEKVLNEALALNPDRADEAKAVRAEMFMATRRFDEAEKLVKEFDPTTEMGKSIRLKLANYYYRVDETQKAKALYDDFFKQFKKAPTDPALRTAYEDASLYLAAMLESSEDYAGAAQNVGRLLAMGPDPDRRRMYEDKQATLLLKAAAGKSGAARKKMLEQVGKLVESIEYGGQYWVARAAVLRAEMARVDDKPDEALAILEKQKSRFKQIDRSLKEAGAPLADSPKSGYHFVRGLIYEAKGKTQADGVTDTSTDEAKAAKQTLATALNEFARVLKYYGAGEYGTEATLHMKDVEDILIDKLGAQLKRRTTIQAAAPTNADELFGTGDTLFKKGDYAHAIEEYHKVLKQFPETKSAPRVLTNLAKAYFEEKDLLTTQAVIGYLGERFAGNPEAARGCLLVATHLRKGGDEALAYKAYQAFAENFPDHEKAPAVLYTVAAAEKKNGNETEAMALFGQLIERYPDSEHYLKVLQAMGADAYKIQNYEEAQARFATYAEAAPEGYDKANAMMLVADSQLRLEEFTAAFKSFRELVKTVDDSDPNNPYYTDASERANLKKLFEQATFQQAYCLSRIDQPKEKVPVLRASAIKLYDKFAEDFPTSDLLAKALAAKGGVLLQLNRMDEATQTFESLSRKYPDTPEGKSSLFTLVEAAVNVGRMEVAIDAVNKMAANPAEYGAEMFARVGQLMLDNKVYDQAIGAYENLLKATEDAGLKERGYFGLGKCYAVKGDCAKAIENLEALLKLNDKTGYFFEANMILGRSYRNCQQYPEAIEALGQIFRFEKKDRVLLAQANYELAEVQVAEGRSDAAYASYLRLALHPDPTRQPELMDVRGLSTLRSAELSFEKEDWDTVVVMADKLMQFWPDHEQIPAVKKLRRDALVEQAKASPVPEPVEAVQLQE